MSSILKYSVFLSLLLSFTIISCDSDGGAIEEELKGIQLVTTRSSGASEGIGIACNFGQILKEHLKETDLDEIKDEVKEESGQDLNSEKFDEFLEEIFGSFKEKTMYMIVAGDNIELERKGEIADAGETFSMSWYSDSEEPLPGTYEALGAKINVENPDDLENGAKVSSGKIEVVLSEINDDLMIGTFSGTVTNQEGAEENIEGSFNVERVSCDK